METKLIKNFPFLSSNSDLNLKLDYLKYAEEEIERKEEEINGLITNIQNNCQHKWRRDKKYDPNVPVYMKTGPEEDDAIYIGNGVDVLRSRTCRLCGLEEIKPEGKSTEICHVCWSKMESEGATRMIFGTRRHMYKCTNPKCNNRSWHN